MSPSAAGTLPEDEEVNHVGDDGYDDDRDGVDDGGNHGKVIPESSRLAVLNDNGIWYAKTQKHLKRNLLKFERG